MFITGIHDENYLMLRLAWEKELLNHLPICIIFHDA
jgi:hypothetical protein